MQLSHVINNDSLLTESVDGNTSEEHMTDGASSTGGDPDTVESWTVINSKVYQCQLCGEKDVEGKQWVKFKKEVEGAKQCIWSCGVCSAKHWLGLAQEEVEKAQQALLRAETSRDQRIAARLDAGVSMEED